MPAFLVFVKGSNFAFDYEGKKVIGFYTTRCLWASGDESVKTLAKSRISKEVKNEYNVDCTIEIDKVQMVNIFKWLFGTYKGFTFFSIKSK